MKKRSSITGITLVAALAAPTFAPTFASAEGHGGQHRAQKADRLVERMAFWDENSDGEVTQAEVDAVRAARLTAFDADGDGVLSLAEYEALWLDAMRERMVDRFQQHDDDGSGTVTIEEFNEDYARMVARMDRNGDGVLSADDAGRRGEGRRGGAGGRNNDTQGTSN